MKAGAARADITPALGIQLAGDIGRHRPTETITDRLYASALVLESGPGDRLCILSLDLLATSQHWSDHIRHGIADATGIPYASIVLHVTQNHASPSIGHNFTSDLPSPYIPPEHPWLAGGDDRYFLPTATTIIAIAIAAFNRLEPVVVHATRAIEGRVAFNRRVVTRDGTARMGGGTCAPDILRVEGVTDPEVAVLTFTNAAAKVTAALLHFTSHPCHGYPRREVIGDWPGAWAANMRNHWGDQAIPLVINGCCGNVIHQNHIDPDFTSNYHGMADKLTQTTIRALDRKELLDQDHITVNRQILPLAPRELTERFAWAAAYLADHPEPTWAEPGTRVEWDWVYAIALDSLQRELATTPNFPYEIQTIRIAQAALVTLMGEPFVEAQLAIKEASPADYTLVAHFCNGYAGYIPTEEAITRGGYETNPSTGSRHEPKALQKIIETTATALN